MLTIDSPTEFLKGYSGQKDDFVISNNYQASVARSKRGGKLFLGAAHSCPAVLPQGDASQSGAEGSIVEGLKAHCIWMSFPTTYLWRINIYEKFTDSDFEP